MIKPIKNHSAKIILISSTFLLAACAKSGVLQNPVYKKTYIPDITNAQIVFDESEYDFGVIKQSGGTVQHDFTFLYTGKDPVRITSVQTSCACTNASVDINELMNGDTGIVTVRFNPNLHEEPEGKFFKTVSLITDPILEPMKDIKIWANIDLDLGPGAFELKDDHHDNEQHE